jgi:hypothetical protein
MHVTDEQGDVYSHNASLFILMYEYGKTLQLFVTIVNPLTIYNDRIVSHEDRVSGGPSMPRYTDRLEDKTE